MKEVCKMELTKQTPGCLVYSQISDHPNMLPTLPSVYVRKHNTPTPAPVYVTMTIDYGVQR